MTPIPAEREKNSMRFGKRNIWLIRPVIGASPETMGGITVATKAPRSVVTAPLIRDIA
jgi:hypothetical protein